MRVGGGGWGKSRFELERTLKIVADAVTAPYQNFRVGEERHSDCGGVCV